MKLHRPVPAGPRAGLTLVEVVVFTALVLMALVGLAHTSVTVHKLQSAEDEKAAASEALVNVLELVREQSRLAQSDEGGWGERMVEVFEPGGALGNEFEIEGLVTSDGRPGTCTVTILVDETLSDVDLGLGLGLPRDLNNDGDATDTDVADTAQLLPVVVRARWVGRLGEREIVQGLLLLGV